MPSDTSKFTNQGLEGADEFLRKFESGIRIDRATDAGTPTLIIRVSDWSCTVAAYHGTNGKIVSERTVRLVEE